MRVPRKQRRKSDKFVILSFLVCDDIRREYTGKDILIGVYNNVIIFPTFPVPVSSVIFRVSLQATAYGTTPVRFSVVDTAQKKNIITSEVEFNFQPQDYVHVFGFGIAGYVFAESTTLKSSIAFGEESHDLPEIIVRLPATDDERKRIQP
jgi:hypothetical protein